MLQIATELISETRYLISLIINKFYIPGKLFYV